MVTQTVHAPLKRGRRPSGVSADGKPQKTSEYPKLTIAMRPEVKARLEAASTLTKLPAWRIVDAALDHYLNAMPVEDRKAIDSMVSRMRIAE
jgi:hypothetical protein